MSTVEIYSKDQVNDALASAKDHPIAKAILESRLKQEQLLTPKPLALAIAREMVKQGIVRL